MAESMMDLNEQDAKNNALQSDNGMTLSSMVSTKRNSEKVYKDILGLIDKKIAKIKQKAIIDSYHNRVPKDAKDYDPDLLKNEPGDNPNETRVPLSAKDSDHLK